MNFVRSNKQSMEYQRFTPLGYKDIKIRKIEFTTAVKLKNNLCFTYQIYKYICVCSKCPTP